MAVLGLPALDPAACDTITLLLMLVFAIACNLAVALIVSLRTPIVDEVIIILVLIAVIQDKDLRSKRDVLVILHRLDVVLVNNLPVRDNLLLVALLGSQQRLFLAFDLAPLLA